MPARTTRRFARLILVVALAAWAVPRQCLSQTALRGGATYNAPPPTAAPLGGDVFSSNGGSRGNTTYRTGTQTFQPTDAPCASPYGCGRGGPYQGGTGSDVYCQDSPGMPQRGPYSHTGTNTPCGLGGSGSAPGYAAPAQQQTVNPIINYYYINGINTPDRAPLSTKGPARGNYQWDWKLIRANLLDLDVAYMGLGARKPLTSIRVSNEIDVMDTQTRNASGKDPVSNKQLDALCTAAQVLSAISSSLGRADASPLGTAVAVCGIYNQMVATLNNLRGNGFYGMAPGDIFECFRQALAINLADVAASFGLPGIQTGIDAFSSQQPEVRAIGNLILAKFHSETSTQNGSSHPNYFIVIGHSQGNFFAEAVAYWLLHYGGPDGVYIFRNRLGVMSFASPTDYTSVTREPGFANRVEHIKRRDDMINALLALPPSAGKRPFTTGDSPALWPFPALDWTDWRYGAAAISAMGDKVPVGCIPANTPQCDGALYTPFLNSHLLENYIADANFTQTDQPINLKTSDMFRKGRQAPLGRSPPTAPPLLNASRTALVRLKSTLLSGSPTAAAAPPVQAQGADLGRGASSMVLKLFGQ